MPYNSSPGLKRVSDTFLPHSLHLYKKKVGKNKTSPSSDNMVEFAKASQTSCCQNFLFFFGSALGSHTWGLTNDLPGLQTVFDFLTSEFFFLSLGVFVILGSIVLLLLCCKRSPFRRHLPLEVFQA